MRMIDLIVVIMQLIIILPIILGIIGVIMIFAMLKGVMHDIYTKR